MRDSGEAEEQQDDLHNGVENVVKIDMRHLLGEEVAGDKREDRDGLDRQQLLVRPVQHCESPAGQPHQPTKEDGEAWQLDKMGGQAGVWDQQQQGSVLDLQVGRGYHMLARLAAYQAGQDREGAGVAADRATYQEIADRSVCNIVKIKIGEDMTFPVGLQEKKGDIAELEARILIAAYQY